MAFFCVSGVSAQSAQRAPGADMILFAAKIFTNNRGQTEASALAVKNGRIYSVGSDADTKAQVRGLLKTTGLVAVDLGTLHVGGPLALLPFCALATRNFVRT